MDKEKYKVKSQVCNETTNKTKIDNINVEPRNALLDRLISKYRTFAQEKIHQRDGLLTQIQNPVKNIFVDVEQKNKMPLERHVRTIWDWKPNNDHAKFGSKFDLSEVKLPVRESNFIKLLKRFCTANCSDMKVIIDDTVFHCHKIVLQSYSKYFLSHIRRRGYKKEVLIEIPKGKVNKAIFMDLYLWMLNSSKYCRNSFANHNILNLLMASAFLQIDELEKDCWNYISDKKNFDEGDAFDLYWEARHASCWPVMQLMLTRIKTFFLTLIQTDRYLLLNQNELHLLYDSNNIAVNSEIEIFFALIIWLRKKNFTSPWQCTLFKLIRFSQMSPIQLVELQSMNELHYLIKQYPICEMIENGLRIAIKREHALSYDDNFVDPEPQGRNWLKRNIVYRSFNEFIDILLENREKLKKPHCELIKPEIFTEFKLPTYQSWTPIVRKSVN